MQLHFKFFDDIWERQRQNAGFVILYHIKKYHAKMKKKRAKAAAAKAAKGNKKNKYG